MAFKGVVDRSQLPGAELVETSVEGKIGFIELNEPEHLNPLGHNEMHIHYALQEMHANEDVWAVILSGRGRAFCAGADLKNTKGPNYDGRELPNQHRLAYEYAFGNMWTTLHDFKKPIIAAVNGYCLGGGWEVAHMCDFIIASDNAVFGAVEIDVGLPPFATTINYLTKMIGLHRALDLIINAKKLSAQEAFDLGLVNKVVPLGDLMTEARTLAESVVSRPPLVVAAIKKLAVRAADTMEDYELERALGYQLMKTEDTVAARQALASRTEGRPEFHAR